jgi:hypothetical protein
MRIEFSSQEIAKIVADHCRRAKLFSSNCLNVEVGLWDGARIAVIVEEIASPEECSKEKEAA